MANPNAEGTLGNAGNTVPKHLQGMGATEANRWVEDINHSARSHPDVHREAFEKLNVLHQHVGLLAAAGSMYAHVAQGHLADAAHAHEGFEPSKAADHVRSAVAMLHEVPGEGDLSPEAKTHLSNAHSAAQDYLRTWTPSKVVPTKADPSLKSVSFTPDYREKVDAKYAKTRMYENNKKAVGKAKQRPKKESAE